MILKLILSVLLLYYLCVLWKYYRTDIAGLLGKTDAGERTDEPDEEAEKPGEPYTVIGKSTYRNGQTYEPEESPGEYPAQQPGHSGASPWNGHDTGYQPDHKDNTAQNAANAFSLFAPVQGGASGDQPAPQQRKKKKRRRYGRQQ